jgi:hypothetical protein
MSLYDLFHATPDHLSKAHFILLSDQLGLAIEMLWKLNLRFYHDGKMPLMRLIVNTALAGWLHPVGDLRAILQ